MEQSSLWLFTILATAHDRETGLLQNVARAKPLEWPGDYIISAHARDHRTLVDLTGTMNGVWRQTSERPDRKYCGLWIPLDITAQLDASIQNKSLGAVEKMFLSWCGIFLRWMRFCGRKTTSFIVNNEDLWPVLSFAVKTENRVCMWIIVAGRLHRRMLARWTCYGSWVRDRKPCQWSPLQVRWSILVRW